MSKNEKNRNGVVYSTDPNFNYRENTGEHQENLDPSQQKLDILLDRKKRKGKEVTLITGYIGPEESLTVLAKELKIKCGTGGSAKHGEIIIQGDHRNKIAILLKDWGYQVRMR